MINRRILRIKAMQSLYSFHILKESLMEVVEESLLEKYALDPAIHDFNDKAEFKERQKLISKAFRENWHSGKLEKKYELEDDVQQDINAFISEYYNRLKKETGKIKSEMVREADDVFNAYLKLLILPGEFAFIEKQEQERRDSRPPSTNSLWKYNFIHNSVVKRIMQSEEVKRVVESENLSWSGDIDVVRKWYKDVISINEDFIAYQELSSHFEEDDYNILMSIYKKEIFKNDLIDSYYQENDLYWNENRSILKNLVVKTLKSIQKDNPDIVKPLELSQNKEEDFEFFEKLFSETIRMDQELAEIIEQKTKNWDMSRIANLDMVIIKMALAEMMTFPSIPVKVTINESLEISKIYSTPKSKQFINGILDVLANELTSDKKIRKSGRGLIDNK